MRLLTPALLTLICGTAPVFAAPPAIVADTPVTGSMVQQVLGDLGTVRVLLPKGASVHHYQMRPSDAQALQSAGLVVWTGPELTPWLDRAAESLGNDTTQLRLLQVPATTLRDYGQVGDDHGHDDHSHDHDHADGHDHDDHVHTGTDPHAWLNPDNGALWLTAIAEQLAKGDPENAIAYRNNAAAAVAELSQIDDRIAGELTDHRDQRFVVFHDAYGYFTDHYGMQPALPLSAGDASSPSASRIAALREQITSSGAICAFPEYGHDAKLITTATEGSDTRTGAPLDPEGSGLEQSPELYVQVLAGLSSTLIDCLNKG